MRYEQIFSNNFFSSKIGDLADLIFVFFDPIGQALCKRTLNIVEELSNHHSEIMRFYLSKADEAGDESDRQVHLSIQFENGLFVTYDSLCMIEKEREIK